MIDIFQARVLVEILNAARLQPKSVEIRRLLQVYEIEDVSSPVNSLLSTSFKDLHNGSFDKAQAFLMNAFWLNYCSPENYSGPARCFVNPPNGFIVPKAKDQVTLSTNTFYGEIGHRIDVHQSRDIRTDLVLSGIEGEEKGFFNEVVLFCDGLIGQKDSEAIINILGTRTLPGVTAFIFEMPNNENPWLPLFERSPNDDVSNILQAFSAGTGMSMEKIEVKNSGPVTSVYFGVSP